MELMNPIILLLIVAAVVAVVFCGIYILIPFLIRKGVDVSGLLSKADLAVDTLNTVCDTVQQLAPNTPGINVVDKILEYAATGVTAAEQLYKAHQVDGNGRKAKATELVYAYLDAAGIKVTDDLRPIVDGAIEAMVFSLPKTHRIGPGADAGDFKTESGLFE